MFADFLDRWSSTYLVVEDSSGHLVACGGLAPAREDAAEARLCWGLVGASRQKEGIGQVLLRVRMAQACRMPGITRVAMDTSNETAPFFEHEGLRTVKVTEHFFRPGLHKHEMVCELDALRRADIETRLGALLRQGHRLEAGLFE